MENINWYPGHMKKTRELIEKNLKLVDVVVEVCDARIPISGRNPLIDDIVKRKPRILLLNKSDLADERRTRMWLSFYGKAFTTLVTNGMSGGGMRELFARLEVLQREMQEAKASGVARNLRVMIVGIPNSGKSSLLNRLAKRRGAQVGDRPGVTRGKQWITIENGMQILDTPGVLWPKFEDPRTGMNLAFCGSIRDEILDVSELGLELIRILEVQYREPLFERYGLSEEDLEKAREAGMAMDDYYDEEFVDSALVIMEAIAKKRGFILPGRKLDYERTARTVLDEFRAGMIGRITLELPPK
ncbi:MAG: ribosome biogenesis GTPase YlqF [Clostridiales Family XIII bacterium]|jgi:ribosome biogenesis GTPase A|nr:ribosome biogenesis GTPase YlqF [Clostridiales Family XIII bacterium]